MDKRIFAIDFTHSTMTAAFVSADGGEEGSATMDLADFMAGESSPMDKLTALLAAKARTAREPAAAVSLSIPCDLSPDRRGVVNFPSAIWMNGTPLADIVEQAVGIPVVMERRAVVMLAYDRVMLGLPDAAIVIGCYVDEHYDNAIWVDGKPLRGRNGAAGNIGHMTINDREDNCHCGKYGCVDLYGAGQRLNQLHTMIFSDTPLESIFETHSLHPLLRDYLGMMAYPIAIEANILDPDFIVLGGSIPSMRGFPRDELENAIRKHCYYPFPSRELLFLASPAGQTPGVVCTAQYAMRTPS